MEAPLSNVIAYGLLVAVLAVAAWTDWRTHKVYNWLTLPAILGGLIYWTVWGGFTEAPPSAWGGLTQSAIGFACGFVPAFVIFTLGALGGGDVKVMGAVGAISANWEVVLGTAFYGLLFGLVMAVFLMFKHGIVKRTFSRLLGAALTAAAKVKTDMPDDSPKIPLGVTFKLGVILAGLEHMLFIPMPWSKWL